VSDSNGRPAAKAKSVFSGFAALGMVEDGGGPEDEEEDFGGLMVR